MGDYLVALFQQWWSAVPIDWWLAEAGRTPSLLLTQEEREVNLSQPHRALLLSARVIWHSGCQETHLITSSLPVTCTINISFYFKEILNAPVHLPSILMWLCMEVWGRVEEWKSGKWLFATLLKQHFTSCMPPSANPVVFSLDALKYSAVNEHLHGCKSDCWFDSNRLKFPVDSVQNLSSWLV